MSRIKRWFVIVLCVFWALPVSAETANTQVILVAPQSAGMALSGAALDGVFYFYLDQLYACMPGQADAVALGGAESFEAPPTLLAADGELLRLDNTTGMLARWDGESFAHVLQLDWHGLGNPASPRFLLWPVWSGDALYGLLPPPAASAGADGFPLVRFDAVTGERTELPVRNLYQLAPYKDGMLLALSLDLLQYTGTGGGTVICLDARTGSSIGQLGTLSGLMDGGIAYDQESDTVYAASGGQVLAGAAGGDLVAGPYFNVPAPLNSTFAGVSNGWYGVFVGTELHLCKLTGESGDAQPLRIKGFGIDENMLQAFGRAHPDIPVARTDILMTDTAAIIADFAAAEDQADLYVLYTFQSLEALKEKGYLADLSGIPGVADTIAAMYPAVQDAVMREGKALAFPIGMTALTGAWSVNDALLEQFGLEMPATMLEYFQLLHRWEEEFAYDNPEYTVSLMAMPREQCVSLALQTYGLTYETAGAPLTLDTPLFRQVLEAIEALPYESVDLEAVMRGAIPMPIAPNARPMIDTTVGDPFNRFGEREEGRPAKRVIPPPPFEVGVPSAVMALVPVYVINPNSSNKELAERFVAFAVAHMAAENRLLFCPDYNEPQRSDSYEADIASLRAEIAELETRLPDIEEADRRTAEEQLASLQQQFEQREAEDFIITAQAIADYRAVAQHLNLLTHSSIVNLDNPEANQELNAILYRYMGGQTTLDEALRELDRRFAMMHLEQVSN